LAGFLELLLDLSVAAFTKSMIACRRRPFPSLLGRWPLNLMKNQRLPV
jgi:hypothetical protein